MSHSRSESAGRSQMPPTVTSPTPRSCSTVQVPQPQAARLVTSPSMVSSRGKVMPFEDSSSNLTVNDTVNDTVVRMSVVWSLLHLELQPLPRLSDARARRTTAATNCGKHGKDTAR